MKQLLAVAVTLGLLSGCNDILGIHDIEKPDSGRAPADAGHMDVTVAADARRPDAPVSQGHDAGTDTATRADVGADSSSMDAPPDVDATVDARPDHEVDAGVDQGAPLVCDGGSTACSGSCVDLETSADHCGACAQACATVPGGTATCQASTCFLSVNEAASAVFQSSVGGPWLAFWRDGTLVVSGANILNDIDTTTGNATGIITGPDTNERPVVYIPENSPDGGVLDAAIVDGGSAVEQLVLHYGSYDAYLESGASLWTNGLYGCCGAGEAAFSIDPKLGVLFSGKGVTELTLGQDGVAPVQNQYEPNGVMYATPGYVYVDVSGGEIDQYGRSDLTGAPGRKFTVQSADAGAGPTYANRAAITATEDIVTLHPELGTLAYFNHNGTTAWQISWTVVVPALPTAPPSPILTASGDVVVGGVVAGSPSLCELSHLTGATLWCTPTSDNVVSVLAGDDGILYAAINNASTVNGYDATTGTLRYTFSSVGFPTELLLRDGRIYAWGAAGGVAFNVPATHYAASSWPVVYHDNQRTTATTGSLAY